jgi:deoxyribose-phosphate aldolase
VCSDCEDATHGPAGPLTRARRALSVGEVAARLEHRLYVCEPTPQTLREGCALAVRRGLSSVIAPPADVPVVGLHLSGTSVGVVTIPGWRNGEVEPLPTRVLIAQSQRLSADGASDIGVVANVHRLCADGGRGFADDVTALVEAMGAVGVRVRVVLDTDGLTPDATVAACEVLGATGAWLVQGGSWAGARTSLSRIQLMRTALPAAVRLKWTFPVKSLDSMLICVAEGVDLFNGDPESLLQEAARRATNGPLVIPERGVDY